MERKLNKVPGAQATVNFATETANVRYDPASVKIPQLIDVVRGAGYDAFEITPDSPTPDNDAGPDSELSEISGTDATSAARDAHAADLRKRLIISAVLSVPVLALSMIPQLQFNNWQWLSFALVGPVFFLWGQALPCGGASESAAWGIHHGHID